MSKGLEDFKELKKTTCFYCQYHIHEECANDECIWNNVEKELKSLDIIKEKGIAFLVPESDYNNERIHIELYTNTLTKEQLALIKEVLGL